MFLPPIAEPNCEARGAVVWEFGGMSVTAVIGLSVGPQAAPPGTLQRLFFERSRFESFEPERAQRQILVVSN